MCIIFSKSTYKTGFISKYREDGYDEQFGTGWICSLQPGFVITGLIYVENWSFGTEKYVLYNWVFVITEFVIIEFYCIYINVV